MIGSDTKHTFKEKPREVQTISIHFNKLIQFSLGFVF